MRRPPKRRPTSRAAAMPALILEMASGLARKHHTTRRAVLLAAARVAVHQPPGVPTAYPTLTQASQTITVYLTPDLYDLALRTEADYFYRSIAWLCFYGMVLEGQQPLVQTLATAEEALADLDRRALEAHRGQPRCSIPTTARMPAPPPRDGV